MEFQSSVGPKAQMTSSLPSFGMSLSKPSSVVSLRVNSKVVQPPLSVPP